ncbi:glycosyltransferase [Lithospermum erythrorhizon]|uniref:Glycosyltransferase n=1 Tax=Lithospermum erythrorhizon TaxID=34254 RepID=A0AAV3RF67_LITER
MLYPPTHYEKFRKSFDIMDPDSDIPTYGRRVPSRVLPTALCIYVLEPSEDLSQHNLSKFALERSGQRFLWSIHQERAKDKHGVIDGFSNLDEILPQGFLERTKSRGMICGWTPQVDVFAHQAIGGFISHCGWNSILESLWHGVPITTWPMYAEQQINALDMVKDLGLAVELKLDYRRGTGILVGADEIKKTLRNLMDKRNPVKTNVMEMKEKNRKAVVHGGSSFDSIGCFIVDILSQKLP